MHELLQKRTIISDVDALNIDSAADTQEIVFGNPVDIYRIGFVASTAVVVASAPITVNAAVRPVVGSSSGQEVVAVLTVPAIAAGKVASFFVVNPGEEEIAEDGNIRNLPPAEPIRVNPGESLFLAITNEAASGAVRTFVEYAELPNAGDRMYNVVEGEVGVPV